MPRVRATFVREQKGSWTLCPLAFVSLESIGCQQLTLKHCLGCSQIPGSSPRGGDLIGLALCALTLDPGLEHLATCCFLHVPDSVVFGVTPEG